MVKQAPVNLALQTIASVFVIISWYAYYRIEKLRFGLIIIAITLSISIGIQMIFPFPYGVVLAIVPSIIIPIYYMRKWSEDWNAKFSTGGSV